jgi:polar amino acid transport system substrate-binding protein
VISSAVEDLKLGRIDAVVVDEAVNAEYLKKLGKSQFKTVQDPSMPAESYGIIVKKGNRELLNKLNSGLKKIKQNGTYDKIYAKYFGDK